MPRLICATCVSEHIRARSLDSFPPRRTPLRSEKLSRGLSTAAQQEGAAVCFSSLKLALGIAECKFITVQLPSSGGRESILRRGCSQLLWLPCKASASTAKQRPEKNGLELQNKRTEAELCCPPTSPYFHVDGLAGFLELLHSACRRSDCSQTKQKVSQFNSASRRRRVDRQNKRVLHEILRGERRAKLEISRTELFLKKNERCFQLC